MSLDSAAVDLAIKTAFSEYDDKATARLNALVEEAYNRAKADTLNTLRQENQNLFEVIRKSADEKLVDIDKKLKDTLDSLNAQQTSLDAKFEHLNNELIKHQAS